MKRTKVAYSISPLANTGVLIILPTQPPTSLPPSVPPVTPPWLISDEWNVLIPSAKIRFTLWIFNSIHEKIVLKIDFNKKTSPYYIWSQNREDYTLNVLDLLDAMETFVSIGTVVAIRNFVVIGTFVAIGKSIMMSRPALVGLVVSTISEGRIWKGQDI